MCDRPSITQRHAGVTLARVLRSLKLMTADDRDAIRRELNAAPEPPSLVDAIRDRRAVASDNTRNARIRAAIAPPAVE